MNEINQLAGNILGVLRPLVFLLIGAAVVAFLWGGVKFIANAANEAERAKGKQAMLWGIIALSVMVSIWGLVTILSGTLGFGAVPPAIDNIDILCTGGRC